MAKDKVRCCKNCMRYYLCKVFRYIDNVLPLVFDSTEPEHKAGVEQIFRTIAQSCIYYDEKL